MTVASIAAIGGDPAAATGPVAMAPRIAEGLPDQSSTGMARGASFGDMLVDGIDRTNARLNEADRLVQAFALDDGIPVHQVTIALEQARLSFELMLQVRSRLLEAHQQLMNMQL